MDCERFDRTTMELLYGELDELSEAAAMRHLHHCTRCRGIWGHLRTTKELAILPQEAAPDDLFIDIMAAERNAQRNLPARERFSRVISVLAGYAMRPQLAMAALLLLMIGSSLVFVRATPQTGEHVSVTERGVPFNEPGIKKTTNQTPLIFEEDAEAPTPAAARSAARAADSPAEESKPAKVDESRTRKTYGEAMLAYQEGRYAEAERLFSEVASAGSEQSASAALHEGHAARNGSGCQRAAALYDSIATEYSGTTVGDEALWHAASCYRAMGQNRRAQAHYEKLAQRPVFSERARAALEEIEATLPAAEEAPLTAQQANDTSLDPSKAEAGKKTQKAGSSEKSDTGATPDPATESKQ